MFSLVGLDRRIRAEALVMRVQGEVAGLALGRAVDELKAVLSQLTAGRMAPGAASDLASSISQALQQVLPTGYASAILGPGKPLEYVRALILAIERPRAVLLNRGLALLVRNAVKAADAAYRQALNYDRDLAMLIRALMNKASSSLALGAARLLRDFKGTRIEAS